MQQIFRWVACKKKQKKSKLKVRSFVLCSNFLPLNNLKVSKPKNNQHNFVLSSSYFKPFKYPNLQPTHPILPLFHPQLTTNHQNHSTPFKIYSKPSIKSHPSPKIFPTTLLPKITQISAQWLIFSKL